MSRNLALEQENNGRPRKPPAPGWRGPYYNPFLAFSVEYYCWAYQMWGDEKYGDIDHESATQMEVTTFGCHITPEHRESYYSFFKNQRYEGDHVGVFLFHLRERLRGEFRGTIIGESMVPAESEAIHRLVHFVALPWLKRMVAEIEAVHVLYSHCEGSHHARGTFWKALPVLLPCSNDFVFRGACKLIRDLGLTTLGKDELSRVSTVHSDLYHNDSTNGRFRYVETLNGYPQSDWKAGYAEYEQYLGKLPEELLRRPESR